MFSIDSKDIKELERDIKLFAERSLPFATKKTLNDAAFQARKIAQADITRDFTLRNKFTLQSVQVEQAKTLNIRKQEAVVGSIADYMETQEFGGTEAASGKYKTVIPTSFSANQEGAKPRTKLPTRTNKLQNIRLANKIRTNTKSRRQKAFLTGLLAANSGDKFVFIEGGAGASTGLYRVWGRNKVNGRYRSIKLKMLYSMRTGVTRIPKQPWLKPSFDEANRMIPAFYADALRFQLKRNKIFS